MPRSPSRDLSDRYIGRRGYFRTPDAIRKGKYALAFIALFGAVGWAAVDVVQPSRANYGHSHGPLANPHAAFDDNCKACHYEYSIKDIGLFTAFNARTRWHNLTCDKCHSGPPHHGSATKEGADRHMICSNCHHDHQGRLFSLVRLNDRDCNACHMDLSKWFDPSKSLAKLDGDAYANKVTSFVTDHPPFRSLGEVKEGDRYVIGPPTIKPRALTFSHAVHMNPGQAYDKEGAGREAMTVKKLHTLAGGGAAGGAALARYAPGVDPDATPDAKVQLACASCHTLDAGFGTDSYQKQKDTLGKGDPARALLPPRADGAYFLPVNYEAHCRSCHPLAAVEGSAREGNDKLIVPRFDLPHRKQTSEVRAILAAGYAQELLAPKKDDKVKPPTEPGLPQDQPPLDKDEFRRKIDELTRKAESILLSATGTCAKCHATEPAKDNGGAAFNIKPVPDRTVWFAHAKFNHASHRGATCAACHPGTEKGDKSPADAEKPEPVQILGLESCRTCHSPTSAKIRLPDGTTTNGGNVRANCTDCHKYHHGDQPLQGRGADNWYPNKPRSIEDWLKGK